MEPNHAPRRHILLIEDDLSLSAFLSAEFRAQSFLVDHIPDGSEAFSLLEKQRYDVMIVECNFPKLDGISLLRDLRQNQPRLPALVLTASSSVEDRVLALQSGADDCITKPFSVIELLARVRALMRRNCRNCGYTPDCSKVGDLILYRDQHRVERNGRRIELTPREFAILEFLMRDGGRPVSRSTLLTEVWNMSSTAATNIVDVYMKYLRDKIDLPGEPRMTHTVRGFGYELRAP